MWRSFFSLLKRRRSKSKKRQKMIFYCVFENTSCLVHNTSAICVKANTFFLNFFCWAFYLERYRVTNLREKETFREQKSDNHLVNDEKKLWEVLNIQRVSFSLYTHNQPFRTHSPFESNFQIQGYISKYEQLFKHWNERFEREKKISKRTSHQIYLVNFAI